MAHLTAKEKKVYDRIATLLNYNNGSGHDTVSTYSISIDYRDLYENSLAQDCKELGHDTLYSLFQQLNFNITPDGMVNTYLPESAENGAAGVIELMKKTLENPKPQYGYAQNRAQQSRNTSKRPGYNIPLTYLPGKTIRPLLPNFSAYPSVSAQNGYPTSTGPKQTFSNQVLPNKNQHAETSSDLNPKEVFLFRASIFDEKYMSWRVAMERPHTKEDERFFEFCNNAYCAFETFPLILLNELIKGKAYMIKFNGKWYRGIYLGPSDEDNSCGLFDFADFEIVRAIQLPHIKCMPKVKEASIPYMITWIYTKKFPDFKEKEKIFCKFYPSFEECCFRKVHEADLYKMEE